MSDCKNIELNKIYNCDCIDLLENLKSQNIAVDCLFTDIPYGGVNRESNGLRNLDKQDADIMTFDLQEFLRKVEPLVKSTFLIFCGHSQVSEIYNFFNNKDITTRIIVWEKTNPSPVNGEYIYLSNVEFCVWAKKPKGTFNAFCKGTVFKCKSGTSELHPTQKPMKLIAELMQENTKENDLVLDTCIGSGTIPLCAYRMHRNFLGAELKTEYFEIAKTRIETEMSQIRFDI